MTEGNTALLDGLKRVIAPKGPKWMPDIRTGKTEAGIARARSLGKYRSPDSQSLRGYFKERPIIGQDAPINGGVYLGEEGREAIVVDDKEDEYLVDAYKDLRNRLSRPRGQRTGDLSILREVYNLTRQILPYNERRAEDLAARIGTDQKVTLGGFIQEGAGVCRHQCLLAGYLLEKLINDRLLAGRVSVDRNKITALGSHAWARYTDRRGEVYIIDATKDFIGTLKDSKRFGKWSYARPSERT